VVDRLGTFGIETGGAELQIADHRSDDDGDRGKVHRGRSTICSRLPSATACWRWSGLPAQFHPQLAVEPIVRSKKNAKPLAVFLTPHAERSLALLAGAGNRSVRTPEACADALAATFAWRSPRTRAAAASTEWPPDFPAARRLDEAQALALFASLGIPVAEHAIAQPPGYAHAFPIPVAAKVLSADILHKTEVGAVCLGIADRGELDREGPRDARARARRRRAVLVQKMEPGLAEAIVGYRDGSVVGPIALVGAGGHARGNLQGLRIAARAR